MNYNNKHRYLNRLPAPRRFPLRHDHKVPYWGQICERFSDIPAWNPYHSSRQEATGTSGGLSPRARDPSLSFFSQVYWICFMHPLSLSWNHKRGLAQASSCIDKGLSTTQTFHRNGTLSAAAVTYPFQGELFVVRLMGYSNLFMETGVVKRPPRIEVLEVIPLAGISDTVWNYSLPRPCHVAAGLT